MRHGLILNDSANAHVLPVVLKMFAAIQANHVHLSMRRAGLGGRTHGETCTSMPAADAQVKQNFPPISDGVGASRDGLSRTARLRQLKPQGFPAGISPVTMGWP